MKYEIFIGDQYDATAWKSGDMPYPELKELVLDIKHPQNTPFKSENFKLVDA